ncbi:MAG: iron-containing alcohol dehydrogenase [Bacteroidaceae bacterium]|nr:iron-containing alcohol dehydrogenase [Bacteroidaceae bacterium]
MKNYYMYVPTKIFFGAGELNNLHNHKLPGKKALLIISNGKSTKANGYLKRTQEQLQMAGVYTVLFDKVEPNPLKSTIMAGGALARESGCDFVVALGGGSCMDASKAIAVMATNDGDLWDYVSAGTGKGLPMKNVPLPIVAITTTAGTGSEVDQWGVITNEETHEKIGFGGSDEMFPRIAIVDPELMKSVPPKLTAYQGFDALFHSVECYVSNQANLMGDMYALTSIENIGKYLVRAVKDGNDMEAREHVAFSNNLSGAVMTISSCTSEHSLEHAMSAYHQNLTHGAGLIMLSKAYFSYFINKHVCDDRFIRLAQALGKKDASKPMDFITELVKLQEACGVADLKMSDFEITPDEFEQFTANAKETMGRLFACDRAQLSDEDCVAIYQESYK